MTSLIGRFSAKVIDTCNIYHIFDIQLEFLEFNEQLKCVVMEITVKDRRGLHWTKDVIKINIVTFAHNSQNMVPRFLKMLRDALSKELNSNRSYNSYSDFSIDPLPSEEVWQEAGLFPYDLTTLQEIKRLMVALRLKKSVYVHSLIGLKFEPVTDTAEPMHLFISYFIEKYKQAKAVARELVVRLETLASVEQHKEIYSYMTNGFKLNIDSVPIIEVESNKELGKSRSLSGGQLLLSWDHYLEQDVVEHRNDKIVVKSRPLEVITVKHENEFYQCFLEFILSPETFTAVQTRDRPALTISDFLLEFSILSRSREVLHKRTLKPERIAEFLNLSETQALKYCMARMAKASNDMTHRKQVWKSIVADARNISLSRS